MAENSALLLVRRVLIWIRSFQEGVSTYFARQRDAKLKRYNCSLLWKDGETRFLMNAEVKAETENQARQLANATAARKFSVLKPPGSHKEFSPPYIQDPKSALALWKVDEVPLSDGDRDLIARGLFGPAAADIGGYSSG
jgi:hypothetical protein